MVKGDLLQVYAFAESLWKTFKCETNEFKGQIQNEIWLEILKPYDLGVIRCAMIEQAKISDFCNIAKVGNECKNIMELVNGEIIDEDKVFFEIDKAIGCYNSKENFEKLSDIAKAVVGDASQLVRWGMSELDEFNTVITSNIKRSIRNQKAIAEKKKSLFASSLGIEFEDKKLLK